MGKLFFIDYDNTLFSHKTMSVPQSALEALYLLQEKGHKVILASGRSFRGNLSEIFDGHFSPDALVSANGAIVEADGNILWEKYFDPEIQVRLFDFVRERKYCLMANYEDCWYTSNMERYLLHPESAHRPLPPGDEEFLKLYDKPMTAFFLEDTKEAIEDVRKHFPELKLLCMSDHAGGADIVPMENSKANGIRLLLDYYHASLKDTVAIGDSMNDLEMLQLAGFGIAMGNAMKEVKDAADYITADIEKDGLKQAILHVLHTL